jgi:ABC-type phosphate transport system substrate-binding protein
MKLRSLVIALLLTAPMAGSAMAEDLAIIVHRDRDVRLTLAEVAQIYLKTRRFWSDGNPIVPVNRDSGSPAREAFVHIVFAKRAPQLVVYWNRQYFRGILPPATLASDEAMRRFVANEPLSIGYVHPSLVDASVRSVLLLTDDRTPPASDRHWLRTLVAMLTHRTPSLLDPGF